MAKLTEPISAQGAEANSETVVNPTIEGQIAGTTPVQPGTSTATEKKLSPKNKITRGIPADWKTTWVDANFPPEEHLRLSKVASQRETSILKLLQVVLKYGLDAYKEQFDADVVAFDASPKATKAPATSKSAKKIEDMSEAELEKAAQTAQQRANTAAANAVAMLAAAKARREAAALAAQNQPAGE